MTSSYLSIALAFIVFEVTLYMMMQNSELPPVVAIHHHPAIY
jgi:hypothetical protein